MTGWSLLLKTIHRIRDKNNLSYKEMAIKLESIADMCRKYDREQFEKEVNAVLNDD